MSGNTERLNAALAGRYKIEKQLGQGGMATVYLAKDIKHDRMVAVKVLKPELAAVLGAERFVVEIKTTAALQHPHILPLFDSGTADGFLYYVMPYIEGETLRGKLNRETQFSVDEAVRITTQVADALDYAHRHGVIHRDIKPENILLHDGRPMVADFGIALAVSAAAGGRMTETGLSLGTPHYMSPEQATAEKEITGRSDIYSLASVMFEMLTGQPPHMGASAQQIIMKIITEQAAPVTNLRKAVPPNVAAALEKALEKLPADRFETAKAFGEALINRTYTSATLAGAPVSGLRSSVSSLPFAVAVSIAAIATVAAVWGWLRPSSDKSISRYSLFLPDSQSLHNNVNGIRVAISADGQTIVHVGPAVSRGLTMNSQLFVRRRDQLRPTPLIGSEDALNPSFSPDDSKIAFSTSSQPRAVMVIPATGGPALQLTDSLVDLGGLSWGYDGYIYYDGHLAGDGVARIRETGGKPEIVSTPRTADGEAYHYMPSALPNGRGVLMTVSRGGGAATQDIAVVDLRTRTHKILARGILGRYAPTGHLVYVTADGMLMAAPFDADRLEVTGDAVVLYSGLSVRGNQRVDVAVSATGTLVYSSGGTISGNRELVWVTRDGKATNVDTAYRAPINGRPTLSPDDKSVVVAVGATPPRPIFVKRLDRGPVARVVEAGGGASWSPDGANILFNTANAISKVPADASSLPVRVAGAGQTMSYSSDGKWIVSAFRGDIVAHRTDGDTVMQVLVADPVTQSFPALSPDDRWLAYVSDETGQYQLYVRPFPDSKKAKHIVSVAGGWAPRWSRSGRELFYTDINFDMWVVSVEPGPKFVTGTPRRLFPAGAYVSGLNYFDVAKDGRFLFTRAVGESVERRDELIVVENFGTELKTKAPR